MSQGTNRHKNTCSHVFLCLWGSLGSFVLAAAHPKEGTRSGFQDKLFRIDQSVLLDVREYLFQIFSGEIFCHT